MSTEASDSSEVKLQPILPNQGIVLSEQPQQFVLCKPKLLPLKSLSLLRMEQLQQIAEQKAKQQLQSNLKMKDKNNTN